MRTALSLAVLVLALAGPSQAAAQTPEVVGGEGAEGTIVTVKSPGEPATTIGSTGSAVTTTTASEPAVSTGSAIGGTDEGQVTTDTSTPTVTAPESEVSEGTTKVTSEEPTTTSTTTSTATTAATEVNVTVDEGTIKVPEDRVRVKVRGAESRSEAIRRRREMESSAMVEALGEAGEPGVDIDEVVTVDLVRAEVRSRAGREVRSRRTLRIEGLRIRGKDGATLVHVRWARMRNDGSLVTRITVGRRDDALTRTFVLRPSENGTNLLKARTYRGTSLADAFATLADSGELDELLERVKAVRIGASERDRDRDARTTSVSVTALKVRLAPDAPRGDGAAAQFGALTAIVGDVSSAAAQAASPLVTHVAEEVVHAPGLLVEGASEIAGAVQSLPGILSGESFSLRPRLAALDIDARTLTIEISCESTFTGELVLVAAEGGGVALAKGRVACVDGTRLTVKLDARLKRFLITLDSVPAGVSVLPQVDLDGIDEPFLGEPVTLLAPHEA